MRIPVILRLCLLSQEPDGVICRMMRMSYLIYFFGIILCHVSSSKFISIDLRVAYLEVYMTYINVFRRQLVLKIIKYELCVIPINFSLQERVHALNGNYFKFYANSKCQKQVRNVSYFLQDF